MSGPKRFAYQAVFSTTIIAAALFAAAPVWAASFDCSKATTTVEKLICSEPELSALDEQLSKAYAGAKEAAGSSQALIADQRRWLAERNRCADAACIKLAYTARLAQLQPAGGEAVAQKATTPSEHLEPWRAACPAPNIDWRNYEWTIIVGNGWTACEEMLGYLRSRPKDQPPAVCPDERLPPNGNWTRPDWKEPAEPLRSELLRDLAAHGQKSQTPKTVRIAHIDITRDGENEMLLLYGDTADHSEKVCRDSARCARVEGSLAGYVSLRGGNFYNKLYAMNDEGTAIDWRRSALLEYGELVYYKGNPYWLTNANWSQKSHDNFDKSKFGPNDPYAAIFRLAPLAYLKRDNANPRTPDSFNNIYSLLPDENATCHFGYFHRDNLKQNPPRRR
ncbi:lysozyme inhibitor LprI family protein [Sulfurivermis fontis]|uniref:lysozyme inhibitor LprI family protein n=1 Tax=Sulfurivermis fontis TaxID=1972068 RepID=UPI000FD90BE8|nr:lysozyme inhibitor LprI family protein [Sulfurivermis fontis]